MASFSQSPIFSTLIPINKNTTLPFSPQPTTLRTFNYSKISASISENLPEPQLPQPDPIKLALAKAKAYKKSTQLGISTPKIVQNPFQDGSNGDVIKTDEVKDGDGGNDVPLAVKIALEKAKEYKKNRSLNLVQNPDKKSSWGLPAGLIPQSDPFLEGDLPEVEILVGDQSKFGNKSFTTPIEENVVDVYKPKVSTWGVFPRPDDISKTSDPFLEGDLPEVEILVGDQSKFGNKSFTTPIEENDVDVYKPKVSTWGVFPRPIDISKAYGGGRTIQPGEALETAEERATKQQRTEQMLARYKTKIGLNIDPKLRYECEKALNDGDSLMDLGKLKEALPFFEQVMEKLVFENELYGLAALQWSICQDSLSRFDEASRMYKKLLSHPSAKVSKKAKQFYSSFQAMEFMKVKSLNRSPESTGYQSYFDEFVKNNTNCPSKDEQIVDEEDELKQVLPYVVFLLSPIFMVFLMAIFKSQ